MLRLVIEDDEGKTTIVPLIRDEITIGRKEGNTIRLTERNVSRHHARLVRTPASPPTILIEDLKSYNGVRLNGDRIADKATLKIGDLIQIGDYALALRDDAADDGRAPAAAEQPAALAGIDAAATEVHQVESLPDDKIGKLVVISSNIAGETYRLDRRELIIGRVDENDIVVNHRSISRNHAKVIFRDGTFTIIDLASSNGVKVNGEPYGTASLVRGDIVELGQVKMRYVAPGDPYIFTPTDIDDSDMLAGPGIGRLILVGLVLACIAVGAFFLVNQGETGKDGGARSAATGTNASQDDIVGWMDEANAYAEKEEWEAAAKMYGRVLQADPDHPEASKKRSWAQKESAGKRQFKRIQNSVKNKQWVDAYRELSGFPIKSTYYAQLAPLTNVIEVGYADAELERAKLLLEDGNRDAARQIYEGIRKQPFAKEQAESLRIALEKRAAPATVAAPVTDAPIAAVRTNAPRSAASPSTRQRVKPVRRDAPETRAPAPSRRSYDELLNAARKELVNGDRREMVRLLKDALKVRPNSKTPRQMLCAVLPNIGRQREALKQCSIWAAKETNPSYKQRAKNKVADLRRALGQ